MRTRRTPTWIPATRLSATRLSDGSRQSLLLAVMLATVGTLHFVVPERFDETIPDEIPVDKRTATLASGVVEVGLAGGLLWPRTRRVSGLASVGLFIAVYPANLNMVRMYWHKPAVRAAMLARLPLQIPMIVAGWQVWKRAS